jgi:hypothetical protein
MRATLMEYMKFTRMTIARLHLTVMVGFNRAILGDFIYTLDPAYR